MSLFFHKIVIYWCHCSSYSYSDLLSSCFSGKPQSKASSTKPPHDTASEQRSEGKSSRSKQSSSRECSRERAKVQATNTKSSSKPDSVDKPRRFSRQEIFDNLSTKQKSRQQNVQQTKTKQSNESLQLTKESSSLSKQRTRSGLEKAGEWVQGEKCSLLSDSESELEEDVFLTKLRAAVMPPDAAEPDATSKSPEKSKVGPHFIVLCNILLIS